MNNKRSGDVYDEKCDHCFDHSLFEERQKILTEIPDILVWIKSNKELIGVIPKLMSFMNINKGVFLLLGLIMALLLAIVWNSRSEMKERQIEYETAGKAHEATIDQRVLFISRDVTQIRQDIAVMTKTLEIHQKSEELERSKDIRKEERDLDRAKK